MTHPAVSGRRTAVVGATLVSTDGAPVIPDSLVIVDGGRFSWVGRRSEREVPADAEILDASGQWMIPGLIEGHCHVSGFASPEYHPGLGRYAAAPPIMEEFAAHGITSVRDTGGPSLESMRLLQHHEHPWPRFFGSGPNLDGHPGGPWKGIWKTDDPGEVRDFVRREHAGGADFIKLYAWMHAPVMQAAVDEAHGLGLRVAAHVGFEVTVEQAVRMGVDALEHVRVGRELLEPAQLAELDALPVRYHDELASGAAWRYADPDGDAAGRVLQLLAEHNVYLTPTLVVHERILHASSGDEPPSEDGNLEGALSAHEDAQDLSRDYTDEDLANGRIEFERICRFVARAHETGIRIVAGSDTPSASIRPGTALHEELRLLCRSGLPPLAALRAATGAPAALLGQSHRIGAIRPGMCADFVLLDADPLEDIANTTKIATTWRDGAPLVSA